MASLAEDEVQKHRHLRAFTSTSVSTVHGRLSCGSLVAAALRHAEALCVLHAKCRSGLRRSSFSTACHSLFQYSAPGSPEAEGKAEYLTTVIDTINQWQGSTIGLAKFFSLARGKLQRHRNGIREVAALQSVVQAVDIMHSTDLS